MAAIFINDLVSFNKEFDDHTKSGNMSELRNSVAILMRNYGYSESEARGIVQTEVSKLEKASFLKYETWKANGVPKSDDLKKYAICSILMNGGISYWMSFSPRYHRAKFLSTVEDRARSTGRHRNLRVLKDYPSPQALSCPGYPIEIMNPFQATFCKGSAEVNVSLGERSCSTKIIIVCGCSIRVLGITTWQEHA
jgi:hypothetical protein